MATKAEGTKRTKREKQNPLAGGLDTEMSNTKPLSNGC